MTLLLEIRIRPMAESDLDAVIALERESDGAPHWGRAEYLAAIENDGNSALQRIALVAEAVGVLAGFAVVRIVKAPNGSEAELESILVAEGLRGRGIGAGLLAELVARAKDLSVIRLDLEVRASNAAAIRLYERAGFARMGQRRGYYSGPDEDAVLMSRVL